MTAAPRQLFPATTSSLLSCLASMDWGGALSCTVISTGAAEVDVLCPLHAPAFTAATTVGEGRGVGVVPTPPSPTPLTCPSSLVPRGGGLCAVYQTTDMLAHTTSMPFQPLLTVAVVVGAIFILLCSLCCCITIFSVQRCSQVMVWLLLLAGSHRGPHHYTTHTIRRMHRTCVRCVGVLNVRLPRPLPV